MKPTILYPADFAAEAARFILDHARVAIRERGLFRLALSGGNTPRTVHAQQAGLVAAKVQLDKGKEDDARATLAWVADTGRHEDLAALARLRLAGVLLDAKKYDEALAQLDAAKLGGFAALGADRRGDVLAAQGRATDAVAAYQAAWKGIPESMDYRRLVEAKLTALGAAPAASGAGK